MLARAAVWMISSAIFLQETIEIAFTVAMDDKSVALCSFPRWKTTWHQFLLVIVRFGKGNGHSFDFAALAEGNVRRPCNVNETRRGPRRPRYCCPSPKEGINYFRASRLQFRPGEFHLKAVGRRSNRGMLFEGILAGILIV